MVNEKILVVEDESLVAMEIKDRLESLRYVVPAIASSGDEAIKKAEELRPDLVLMDIVLKGDMDGIETAEYIRNHFDTPVIYLTAYADEETLQRAKVTEPFGYILKPFEERELHIAIEIALYKHQMDRKLKESEERYRTLVETIKEGMGIVDPDENIVFANPSLCDILGYSREETIGMNLRDTVPEEEFQKILQETEKRKKGVSSEYELVMKHKDGELRNIEISATPWINKKGEFQGTIGLIMDITERKKAEEKLRKAHEEVERALEKERQFKKDTAHYFFNPIFIAKGFLGFEQEIRDSENIKKAVYAIERIEKVIMSIVKEGEIHE